MLSSHLDRFSKLPKSSRSLSLYIKDTCGLSRCGQTRAESERGRDIRGVDESEKEEGFLKTKRLRPKLVGTLKEYNVKDRYPKMLGDERWKEDKCTETDNIEDESKCEEISFVEKVKDKSKNYIEEQLKISIVGENIEICKIDEIEEFVNKSEEERVVKVSTLSLSKAEEVVGYDIMMKKIDDGGCLEITEMIFDIMQDVSDNEENENQEDQNFDIDNEFQWKNKIIEKTNVNELNVNKERNIIDKSISENDNDRTSFCSNKIKMENEITIRKINKEDDHITCYTSEELIEKITPFGKNETSENSSLANVVHGKNEILYESFHACENTTLKADLANEEMYKENTNDHYLNVNEFLKISTIGDLNKMLVSCLHNTEILQDNTTANMKPVHNSLIEIYNVHDDDNSITKRNIETELFFNNYIEKNIDDISVEEQISHISLTDDDTRKDLDKENFFSEKFHDYSLIENEQDESTTKESIKTVYPEIDFKKWLNQPIISQADFDERNIITDYDLTQDENRRKRFNEYDNLNDELGIEHVNKHGFVTNISYDLLNKSHLKESEHTNNKNTENNIKDNFHPKISSSQFANYLYDMDAEESIDSSRMESNIVHLKEVLNDIDGSNDWNDVDIGYLQFVDNFNIPSENIYIRRASTILEENSNLTFSDTSSSLSLEK